MSLQKKKSQGKIESLTRKEKVTQGKKKSHGKRKSITAKENVSQRKKISHKKTRKKLKTIVINETIYIVLLLRE